MDVACSLVGLHAVLKAFDYFPERPASSSIGAYEAYVYQVTSILMRFFGDYTAKQIARAACHRFAPKNASPEQQLAAATKAATWPSATGCV